MKELHLIDPSHGGMLTNQAVAHFVEAVRDVIESARRSQLLASK